MIATELIVTTSVEVLFAGGFLLLYPRIARRGLFFGVYVGESASESSQARAIRRGWDLGVLTCVIAGLASAYLVYSLGPPPALAVASLASSKPTSSWLPVMTVAAGLVFLVAHAKRGLRHPDDGRSLPPRNHSHELSFFWKLSM